MFTRNRLSPAPMPRLVAIVVVALMAAAPAVAQELPSNQYKDGVVLHEAFRDVVKEARQYTVEVISHGRQVALGTIIEADGFILTKASQLEGTEFFVQLFSGKRFAATIVGIHAEYDLALLKIEANNLPVVQWNTDFEIDLGRWLATPGTGELPVAVGVVAVMPREIPIMRGLLGVTFQDAPDGGAEVTEILPESGAEKAGIRIGDIITLINGKSIQTGHDLRAAVQDHSPGEGIVLRIHRNGQEFDVIATLGNPESRQNTKSVMQNSWGPPLSVRRAGFPLVMQHDTVLSAEQCGGPIVDLSGKAIGINIARAGRTESFTLMVEQISPVIAELKSGKLAPHQLEKPLQLLAENPERVPNRSGQVLGDSRSGSQPERMVQPEQLERPERRDRLQRLVPGGGENR